MKNHLKKKKFEKKMSCVYFALKCVIFCVDAALTAVTEKACFACPSSVYCRGHPLPSVSSLRGSNILTSSHPPSHPLPWLPISLPVSFSECHITQQRVYCNSVFLFSYSYFIAFIADLKTKAFDSLGFLGNKRDYWEAQLLGCLDPVRDFAALLLSC